LSVTFNALSAWEQIMKTRRCQNSKSKIEKYKPANAAWAQAEAEPGSSENEETRMLSAANPHSNHFHETPSMNFFGLIRFDQDSSIPDGTPGFVLAARLRRKARLVKVGRIYPD
jgi:hypothetical protein